METAKLDLKVNELDIRLKEISLQYFIYLKSILLNGVNFIPGSKSQGNSKIAVNQRIT